MNFRWIVVGGFRSRFISAGWGLSRLLLLPLRRRNPARRSRTDGVEIAQSCDRFSLHRDEIGRGPARSIVCIGVCREQHHRAQSWFCIDRWTLSNSDPRFRFYQPTARDISLVDYGWDFVPCRVVPRDEAQRWIMTAKLLISSRCPKAQSVFVIEIE